MNQTGINPKQNYLWIICKHGLTNVATLNTVKSDLRTVPAIQENVTSKVSNCFCSDAEAETERAALIAQAAAWDP